MLVRCHRGDPGLNLASLRNAAHREIVPATEVVRSLEAASSGVMATCTLRLEDGGVLLNTGKALVERRLWMPRPDEPAHHAPRVLVT